MALVAELIGLPRSLPETLLLVWADCELCTHFQKATFLPILRRLQEGAPPALLDPRGENLTLHGSHPPHSHEGERGNTAPTFAPEQIQFPEDSFHTSQDGYETTGKRDEKKEVNTQCPTSG